MQRSKPNRAILWIVIGLVLMLALVTGGLWVLRHRQQQQSVQQQSQLPAGSSTHSMTVDSRQRTYRVYRPASLSADTSAPLVVMLHGALGSGKQAELSYGWDKEADKGHFIVAYPDGLNRSWTVSDGCCGKPVTEGVNDVNFITAMISEISRSAAINQQRIYATGISNGGMLDYRLACDTDIFAAIGPDSATMLGSCPSPKPISIIHIHGTADKTIPYSGGPGKLDNGSPGRDTSGPPIPDLINTWRTTDNCSPATSSTKGVVTTSVASCPDGRNVDLITIAGAGHQWPGGAEQKSIGKELLPLDPPSQALNATDTIWKFFSAHSK